MTDLQGQTVPAGCDVTTQKLYRKTDLIFGHAMTELKQVANIYSLHAIVLSTGEHPASGCCLLCDLASSTLVENVYACVCLRLQNPCAAPLKSHPSWMGSGTKSRPRQNTAIRTLKTDASRRSCLAHYGSAHTRLD